MFTVRARLGDLAIGLVFAAIAIYVMAVAWHMPQRTVAVPGPGFFPFWAGVLLAAIGLVIAARSLRIVRGGAHGDDGDGTVTVGSGNIAFAIAALAGCAFLFERIGFVPTAGLFLFAMFWRLSTLSPAVSFAVAFAAAFAVDLFFRSFLGLYLPPNPPVLAPLLSLLG
jgi:hypothetical protein